MEIYIEYVIIDNLVINSLILFLVWKTLKLRSNWLRVLLGAIIGTAVACVLPLFNLSSIIELPIKMALGVLMILCLARFFEFKKFAFACLLLVAYTILLAGGVMAILMLFGTSVEMLADGGYDIAVPYGIILLIVSLYVYIIGMVARFSARKRVLYPFIRKVTIYVSGKVIDFVGFIDSGNSLKDKKTGLPIVIISLSALEKYFSKHELEELVLMQEKGNSVFKGVHTTSYSTVASEVKRMVLFEAEKMVIYDGKNEYITNSFMVGVSFAKFKDAIRYDLLLNPAVL